MKKIIALLLASACILNLAGCGNQTKNEVSEAIKKEDVNACEYSFSGEHDAFKISNGHIYIDKISRFDGGELEITEQAIFEDLASYSEKYYVIANGEKHMLLSYSVKDKKDTAGTVSKIVQISESDLFDEDNLMNNLWYELGTVSEDGEEQSYVLQLNVTKMEK